MNVTEAAKLIGVTTKALKYYESIGLVTPERGLNGYRHYGQEDIALLRQIRSLTESGLSVKATRPFVECLQQGHAHGDDCVESLAAYRHEIARIDSMIADLAWARDGLQQRLNEAASRGFPLELVLSHDQQPTYGLPSGLPVPSDDGRADHLVGMKMPNLALIATDGMKVSLREVSMHRWLMFVYPTTGIPGQDMPAGWDEIPGARGCTPQACGFRDHIQPLKAAGIDAVFGMSVQTTQYQQELAARLRLPYLLLSDPEQRVGNELNLPTFNANGEIFYQRLTMLIRGNVIEHVFYPIFPPNEHAAQVLKWLTVNLPVSTLEQ